MKTTPDKQKLIDLIDDARTGKIVLPQFQRNFVWNRDDITALLVSILEGHFIGSFLLLRTDRDEVPFAIRALQGVEIEESQIKPEWMILDGQQRLTSLHYAFAAPDISLKGTKYPYRFFLDLKKVAEGEYDEAIWSDREDWCEQYLSEEYQFENLVIPFTVVEDWVEWQRSYEEWLSQKDRELYFDQYFKIDRNVWMEISDRIRHFEVPTIEIPKIPSDDPERIAEVCAIFEKMNSTGVKLSVYDLLTARIYRYGIDLHALWQSAVEQNDLIAQFSGGEPDAYGIFALRTLSFIRGTDAKSKTLINLTHENFEEDWQKAIGYIEKALERIVATNEDGFGVIDERWMPYSTMISPMAAMLYLIDEHSFGHKGYKLLRKWYWSSVFMERFATSVESRVYRDFQEFLKALQDEEFEPEAIQDARVQIVEGDTYSLRSFSRVNSVYRGVMCLITMKGAKDFQADDSIEFHALDDHHVFPKAFLRKIKKEDGSRKYPDDAINSIVNRTLISSQTNRRISRRSPSDYINALVPSDRADEIMESHHIDHDGLNAMNDDNYDAFLDARELELMLEIHKRLS